MKILSLIASVLICSGIFAQNYTAGYITTELIDSMRGNKKIPVEIFYPEVQSVTNGEAGASSDGRFPVICFAHGYMMPSAAYLNIREALVPAGFILVFPETASGVFPSHDEYSEDLAFVLGAIDGLVADTSSPLHGITDTVRCLMGHSMGGGAIFAAANRHPDINAVVALAPFNTSPSAIQAASSVAMPTLIFAGSNDCITPPEKHQYPIYNFSASAEKTYILIKGGTHCQMGSHNSLCNFGETMAFCKDGISREEQHQALNRYLLPWLNFFLKSNYEAGIEFDTSINYDIAVEYLRSRPLVDTGDLNDPTF